jgi:3-deoxy-manno-octulosonate cytidylyltransferase (CMP-KDO synthetase)
MVEHVYNRAMAASSISSVIVATDDERIYRAVRAFGGNVRMTHKHHQNGMERLSEIAPGLSCDFIVNVQGDEPLIEPDTIDLVLKVLTEEPETQMSTACCPITTTEELIDPNVVKVIVENDGFALSFYREAPPNDVTAKQSVPVQAYRHLGLYAYRREFLLKLASLEPTRLEQTERLEQLRALEHGFRIRIAEVAHGPSGVDTLEDLDNVRRIVSAGEPS